MLPKVIQAYHECGYQIDLGTPARVYSKIIDLKSRRTLSVSGGFTVTDAFLFMQIQRVYDPKSVFVIGNSFGLSTFVLAEVFPGAVIDAIDAEIEGLEAKIGTALTREIAAKYFPNVNVTVGFSPNDIPSALRRERYDLVFVDGGHTNEQMLLDFHGILAYCSEECAIVFHDVAYANLLAAWDQIVTESRPLGFVGFKMGYTMLGTCVLARCGPHILDYLNLLATEFSGPYQLSYSETDQNSYQKRPFFWDMSFGYLERLIRRKIRSLLGCSDFASRRP